MKKYKFPWQYDIDVDPSVDIETPESSLHKVTPRSDYVHELRDRLGRVTPRPKFVLPKKFQYIVLGLVGFVSGVVLLLTGIKAITTLLATLGIIRQLDRERTEDQIPDTTITT